MIRVERALEKRTKLNFFDVELPFVSLSLSLSHLEQLGRDELAHTAGRSGDEHELSGLDDCSESDDRFDGC